MYENWLANRPLSRYKLFFCLHSNLPGKPRSRALKSKEYVIQYEQTKEYLIREKGLLNTQVSHVQISKLVLR